MLFAGLIEPKPPAPAIEPNQHSGSAVAQSIVVVADGSRSWIGATADAMVGRLGAELGCSWSIHVVRFDAERVGSELHLTGHNGDLVRVAPQLPMKDAIALALNERDRLGGPAAVVLIAREQVYPTYLRTDKLMSSLQKSGLPVHSIHLRGRTRRGGVFRRVGSGISNSLVWLTQALIEEDREVYSAEATGRMLSAFSKATGGNACSAPRPEDGLLCVTKLARSITRSSRNPRCQSTADAAGAP
jgi:hypothetical protein